MADTFTTRNRFQQQEVGQHVNTWGTELNAKGGSALADSALDGVENYTLSGTKTLTSTNGTDSEAIQRVQNITGGTGGTITIPSVEKNYIVRNASSGDVIISAGGATATIKSGNIAQVFCDGSDVFLAMISDYGSVQLKSSATASGPTHLVNKALLDATAFSAALPGQTGNAGKRVTTDGTLASWSSITSGEVTTALGYTPTSVTTLTGVQSIADFKTGLSLTKSDVGLGNVTNTADADKPVSTAQQSALDLKANLASPTLTGTPAAPTATLGTNTTQLATTEFVQTAVADSASGAVNFIYTPTGAYILGDRFPLVDTGNNIGTADRLYATPLSKKMTADAMVAHLNAATASSTYIIGIYAADGTDNGPGTLIEQSGTISGNTTGTIVSTLASDQAITEPVWLVIQTGATPPKFAPGSASGGDINLAKDWPQTSLSALVRDAGFYFNRTFAVLPGTFPGTARTAVATSNIPVMALRQT